MRIGLIVVSSVVFPLFEYFGYSVICVSRYYWRFWLGALFCFSLSRAAVAKATVNAARVRVMGVKRIPKGV